MKTKTCDILILGGGMVGLSLAYQLIERGISKRIIILDKEKVLGKHSSGRNSGVLHAGIYYKPGSLKARVCVSGAKRLKKWVSERNLPINNCGKIIVPQKESLDMQLDVLAERGNLNGAEVDLWNEKTLKDYVPFVRTASGRALWSPNTSVVKPLLIIKTLSDELKSKGVEIMNLGPKQKYCIDHENMNININSNKRLEYKFVINCTGLQADKIAHSFGLGLNYRIIPFKGLYWQINNKICKLNIPSNIYPVPDLNVPFLGVHFTPSADNEPLVSIGPTAVPALGRENYNILQNIQPIDAMLDLAFLGQQYFLNN